MSSHREPSGQLTQNQKNQMSDDPGDGARNSDRLGRAGEKTAVEQAPDAQDQDTIEAFGRKGSGQE